MRDFKGPTELEQLIQRGTSGDLQRSVQRLERLSQRVKSKLPSNLASVSRVGTFAAGILTLVIDERALLTEARFESESLRQSLIELDEFRGLSQVKWRLARPAPVMTPGPKQAQSSTGIDLDEWLDQNSTEG